MKFETAKEKFLEARKATNLAKIDKKQAETDFTEHQKKLPEFYQNMVEVQASFEADETTKKEAEKAKSDYQNAVEKVNELKQNIDVKTKLVPMRMKQERKALSELSEASKSHFKGKAKPILNDIVTAFTMLDKATKQVDELSNEIRKIGLQPYNFIPNKMKFSIDTGGRLPVSVENFLSEIETLKQK